MTTLNAAAALIRKSKVARAIIATSLAFTLAGCETGSSLLGTADSGTPAAAVATPAAPPPPQTKIAIAPVIGAPDAVSRELQGQLGKAAERMRVAVTKSPAEKAEYTLRGYIVSAREKSGTKVSYIWDVTDPAGKRVHRITGEEIAGKSSGKDPWSSVTPEVVQKISDKTASSLSTWLSAQAAPAVASNGAQGAASATQTLASTSVGAGPSSSSPSMAPSPTTTASIERSGSLATHVPSVIGAPGDGSIALTNALKAELARNGVSLADATGGSYKVQGKVQMGANAGGKQPIQIDWTVTDPKGKQLGTVSQKNEIPAGSLDGAWGKTADAAAAAAAQGILKLLPQPTRTN
jgi:hypothetical protein